MALYKNASYLQQNSHANFDKEWKPGEVPPDSGIYRCRHCGDEIAANKGNPLPPQNHHQHNPPSNIRWQLIVCSVQR